MKNKNEVSAIEKVKEARGFLLCILGYIALSIVSYIFWRHFDGNKASNSETILLAVFFPIPLVIHGFILFRVGAALFSVVRDAKLIPIRQKTRHNSMTAREYLEIAEFADKLCDDKITDTEIERLLRNGK